MQQQARLFISRAGCTNSFHCCVPNPVLHMAQNVQKGEQLRSGCFFRYEPHEMIYSPEFEASARPLGLVVTY